MCCDNHLYVYREFPSLLMLSLANFLSQQLAVSEFLSLRTIFRVLWLWGSSFLGYYCWCGDAYQPGLIDQSNFFNSSFWVAACYILPVAILTNDFLFQ